MYSVKQKLDLKSLGEKFPGFERPSVKSVQIRTRNNSVFGHFSRSEGLSNKDIAAKYGVPRNTISTWVKSKSKYFAALEQSSNKRKKTKK